jgi:hypothetical protein
VHGKDEHLDARQFRVQGFGHRQTGQTGHVNVGHQYVRLQLSGFAESFLAIGGFPDDLQIWVSFQAGDDAPAHDGMVVREEQSDALVGLGAEAFIGRSGCG